MTADAPDLSIVLVNWNACEMTSTALQSIATHTRNIRYEIFVIDNGSTRDRSVAELPRRFPSMQFIPNASNMGFSIANNQGIARARGRYVLLLNNDTIQTENALGAAVRYMDGHAEVGALSILHLNADVQRSEQTFVHFRSHLSYIRKHHSSVPAALYYLVMVGRLTLATLWQTVRWLGGAASLADVRERRSRQLQFALLRPGRTGG